MFAKRVYKDFDTKNLGKYYDLYSKIYALLLADVFENFRKMCLKICHLNPAKFLSAAVLPWQTVS